MCSEGLILHSLPAGFCAWSAAVWARARLCMVPYGILHLFGAFPPQSWWLAQSWPPFVAFDHRLAASVLELALSCWQAKPPSQLRRKVVLYGASLANMASTQSLWSWSRTSAHRDSAIWLPLWLPSSVLALQTAPQQYCFLEGTVGDAVSQREPLDSCLYTALSAGRLGLAVSGQQLYSRAGVGAPHPSNSNSTASITGPWVAAAAEETSRPLCGLQDPTGMPCGSRQLQWLSCPGSPGTAPGHQVGVCGRNATTIPSSASSSSNGCCTQGRQPVTMLMRSGQDSTWEISTYHKGMRSEGMRDGF